uniref:Uncharacterized protein n=1 Tax=Anguilla anguilla TaxID=7936 RepID=A0A0E9WHM9_ANGAN
MMMSNFLLLVMLGLFAQGKIDGSSLTLDFCHVIFSFFTFNKSTLFSALS